MLLFDLEKLLINKQQNPLIKTKEQMAAQDKPKTWGTPCLRVLTKAIKKECKATGDKFSGGSYGSLFSTITCYCHHFTEDMKHCVAIGVGPESSRKCKGVMWGSAWSPTSLTCGEPRKNMSGHSPCNADRCPYIAANKVCPYSA